MSRFIAKVYSLNSHTLKPHLTIFTSQWLHVETNTTKYDKVLNVQTRGFLLSAGIKNPGGKIKCLIYDNCAYERREWSIILITWNNASQRPYKYNYTDKRFGTSVYWSTDIIVKWSICFFSLGGSIQFEIKVCVTSNNSNAFVVFEEAKCDFIYLRKFTLYYKNNNNNNRKIRQS